MVLENQKFFNHFDHKWKRLLNNAQQGMNGKVSAFWGSTADIPLLQVCFGASWDIYAQDLNGHTIKTYPLDDFYKDLQIYETHLCLTHCGAKLGFCGDLFPNHFDPLCSIRTEQPLEIADNTKMIAVCHKLLKDMIDHSVDTTGILLVDKSIHNLMHEFFESIEFNWWLHVNKSMDQHKVVFLLRCRLWF